MNNETNITDFEDAVELISSEVWDYSRGGGTFKHIAQKTGLNSRTISKLHYRETKLPRFDTVIRLLHFFGYSLYARKSNVQVLPIKAKRRA